MTGLAAIGFGLRREAHAALVVSLDLADAAALGRAALAEDLVLEDFFGVDFATDLPLSRLLSNPSQPRANSARGRKSSNSINPQQECQ